MKRKKYSEERFMAILWDLYQNTTNGKKIIRYCNFCKEHNITNNLFPVLIANKILVKEKVKLNVRGKHTYAFTWASIQPNIHMAKKLMEELMKKTQNDNAKRKERLAHQQLTELPEMPVCDIIEKNSSSIVPVYEITQKTTDTADFFGAGPDLTKESYVVNVPKENYISDNVSASSNTSKEEKLRLSANLKANQQKSISIAWGFISIKW